MAGFTENALIRKLQELNSSQQSIQTLSLWLIHHRKHHAAVVKTWHKELLKAKDHKQLTFLYLANDVIQNSKKKGPEYGQEFGIVLKDALKHMAKTGINAKTKHSLHRILNIWQERGVYDAEKIQELKVAVDPNDAIPAPEKKPSSNGTKRKSTDQEPVSEKKAKKEDSKPRHERRKSETKVAADGHIETHTLLSPKTPPGDPPEPEELIKALQELESSASSDEAVRERIASLPPEVSEIQLLSKLQEGLARGARRDKSFASRSLTLLGLESERDGELLSRLAPRAGQAGPLHVDVDKESALSLSAVVNSAVELLAEYNVRLAEELARRRRAASMLRDFAQAQRELARQAEARLEEYNIKLQKIYAVKTEVKSHIENLPDVSRLPDVSGGLAPLPSAGDLFCLRTP